MILTKSQDLGRVLTTLLGIEFKNIRSITVQCSVGEAPTVTIVKLIESPLDGFTDVKETFAIVERDTCHVA